jgi:DNA-binding GntR family transcriptional regulator
VSIKHKYKTITQLVVENLRERILTGKIKSGERLNQDVIAKEYNVSKIPIREALQLLKGEGYVSIEANKGAIASVLNSDQIDELFALKVLLEADLLAASLPLISDEKLVEAQQIIEKIHLVSSAQQWNDLNIEYSNCLYSGIKRPQTEEMLGIIKTKVERFNYECFIGINKTKHYMSISKLVGYCADRKIDQAVEQLKQHLGDSKDEIIALLQ